MKIRNGFVSNSSSSSFIVACKENAKATVTIEIDLSNYGESCETIDELNTQFIDNYGYGTIQETLDDNPGIKESYEACKKAIEEGRKVIIGRFSSDSDDGAERFLREHGIKSVAGKNIQFILGDE